MENINKYQYCDLINLTSDAYSSILNHALLTENEEIMGLLIANEIKKKDSLIINIFSTICLTRKCKEKNRVEFDEIQMAHAIEITNEIKNENKIDANVVGWYHSHPKITIPPSNVDLNTQKSQQYQGTFVGLIVSCFSTDSNKINKINLIAFQTKSDKYNVLSPHYIKIEFVNELEIFGNNWSNTSNNAMTFASILQNLLNEEEEQYNKEKEIIDEDDSINKILLYSNRQSLLCKIIQNVSSPYVNSLDSEIENLRNYLEYIKEINMIMRDSIKKFEEFNHL
jgi:BRCA1/BRCA2-containing complex subunit 3